MARKNPKDRCPCGSGKKYKRCCMAKEAPVAELPPSLLWKQVRAARESLNGRMLDYSTGIYDRTALQRAWEDWCCDVEEPLVMRGSEFVAFMSWFLVNWLDHDDLKKTPLPPIAWQFRTDFGDRLSPIERDYLNSVIDEPFSFFEIITPKPGEGYLLRDILTGREIFVHERSGSQGVTAGSFLYGKLAKVGAVAIFDSVSEILFPIEWKTAVLELRQEIRRICKIKKEQLPSLDQVSAFAAMIRGLYRDFRHAAQNRRPPRMTNTDGDPLSFNKVIFDIVDPDEVFDALSFLNFNDTEEEMLKSAKKDAEGRISQIEFPWLRKGNRAHKAWENTVLGQITIEKTRLTVETNSVERAKAIRDIIAKHCGTSARYRTTLIEPIEAKLAESRNGNHVTDEAGQEREQQDLMNQPEIKAQIQAIQRKHMESWVSQKVPALGNKTPTQAVKTSEGREMVETLLAQFEKGAGLATGDKEFEVQLLREIRARLGILKED